MDVPLYVDRRGETKGTSHATTMLTSLSGSFLFTFPLCSHLSYIVHFFIVFCLISLYSSKTWNHLIFMCVHMEAQVFGTVSSSNTILFPWIPLYLSTMGGKFLFGIYCHCIHLKCKIWGKGIDHKASWDNCSRMMEMFRNLTVVVVIQLYTSIRTHQTYT